MPGPLRQRRNDLNRTGCGSDDPHAKVREIDIVGPVGGVEHRTGERAHAGQVRYRRAVQLADRCDKDVGADRPAIGHGHHPLAALVVPSGTVDRHPEPDVLRHPEVSGHPFQVGEDLGLRRPFATPLGVRCEREAVQVTRNIARGSGVGVVAPGATERVGLFEDRERMDSRPSQQDSQADPAETGPDDQDAGGPPGHGPTIGLRSRSKITTGPAR